MPRLDHVESRGQINIEMHEESFRTAKIGGSDENEDTNAQGEVLNRVRGEDENHGIDTKMEEMRIPTMAETKSKV